MELEAEGWVCGTDLATEYTRHYTSLSCNFLRGWVGGVGGWVGGGGSGGGGLYLSTCLLSVA